MCGFLNRREGGVSPRSDNSYFLILPLIVQELKSIFEAAQTIRIIYKNQKMSWLAEVDAEILEQISSFIENTIHLCVSMYFQIKLTTLEGETRLSNPGSTRD